MGGALLAALVALDAGCRRLASLPIRKELRGWRFHDETDDFIAAIPESERRLRATSTGMERRYGMPRVGRLPRGRLGLFLLLVAGAVGLLVRLKVASVAMQAQPTLGSRSPSPRLRMATFNIERYGDPEKRTDDVRLLRLLRGLDADLIAVQEIQDRARFAELVGSLGRGYRVVLSECGGRRRMHVGFVYDANRLELVGSREYRELNPDGEGSCSERDRPGLVAELKVGEAAFAVLVVHLKATVEDLPARREQWKKALAVLAPYRARGLPVALMGDVNSTGFLDNAGGERDDLRAVLAGAGLRIVTERVGCSEYFERQAGSLLLEVALLDHIAVTGDFPIRGGREAGARVAGYCSEVGCPAELKDRPRDFKTVSDHCPVVAGGR